jgi:hypothetical protein
LASRHFRWKCSLGSWHGVTGRVGAAAPMFREVKHDVKAGRPEALAPRTLSGELRPSVKRLPFPNNHDSASAGSVTTREGKIQEPCKSFVPNCEACSRASQAATSRLVSTVSCLALSDAHRHICDVRRVARSIRPRNFCVGTRVTFQPLIAHVIEFARSSPRRLLSW